jgi:hypothetical protein
MVESGGQTANRTGDRLETFIEHTLTEHRYTKIEPVRFVPAMSLEQPIYSRKVKIGTSIYDLPSEYDFAIYHPKKHPEGLIIEAKWQQSQGTVDEKFPYLVTNIQFKYHYKTIVVLDGGGYRKGAERWIRSQVGNKLLAVYNMAEFQTWVNKGGF